MLGLLRSREHRLLALGGATLEEDGLAERVSFVGGFFFFLM